MVAEEVLGAEGEKENPARGQTLKAFEIRGLFVVGRCL